MSKLSAEFVETKIFEVLAPGTIDVLVDENQTPFTIELWAPQSDYMQDFDEKSAQNQLLKNARTNGKANTNLSALQKSGALRLAHAIKSWHPVSSKGLAITEQELPFNQEAIALVLMDREVRWWLTEQITDFFDKNNFVVSKSETAELAKKMETTETAAS